jgi:16S rRNA processing protein RimM
MKPEFFAIGQIVKSSGLKGTLVVRPLTDNHERFSALRNVWIGTTGSDQRSFQVKEACVKGQSIHLRVEEIRARDAANALVGKFLCVTGTDLVQLPEGTHFVHDIVGLRVIDERGKKIGTVEEVWKLRANDVYVVRNGKREHLVPAIRSIIDEIDTGRKQIRIRMIEGL